MANVKTITATTTESAVEFSATYQFMWFRNFGENDCYICDHSGIVANADNVILLKAGEIARLTLPQSPAQSKAYIKAADGSNTVEVHAQTFAECPFKKLAKGGEEIDVIALNVTENDTYTAPSGTAYSPVVVNVPSGIGYIEQIDYVQTSDSGTAGFSLQLQQGDIIHLDMQILRHNSEQGVIGNSNYNTEVYLDGGTPKEYGSGISWAQDMDTSNVSIGERRMYKVLFGLTATANVMFYRKGSPAFPTYGNIYGIKVYRNGVEIMNIVPAKPHGSNQCFMYDTINHIVYYSTMDADFTPPTND